MKRKSIKVTDQAGKVTEILAVWAEDGLICAECVSQKELEEFAEFLTQNDIDDANEIFACERCKKRL